MYNEMTKEQQIAVLDASMALLSDPTKHTTGGFARMSQGTPTVDLTVIGQAGCFCAMGAIAYNMEHLGIVNTGEAASADEFHAIWNQLDYVTCDLYECGESGQFDDDRAFAVSSIHTLNDSTHPAHGREAVIKVMQEYKNRLTA